MSGRRRVRLNTNPWRHAPGFGDYVKATLEQRHSVRSGGVWKDGMGTHCGQCGWPVVAVKIN